MLSFTGSLKVFVALEPVDMRKGFEGLHAAVNEKLKADVCGGAIFAFTNKRRTRLKVLYWDKTGLWLMTKRLEKGIPQGGTQARGDPGSQDAPGPGGLRAADRRHRHARGEDAGLI